jgi:plastocyanin domain-containing protein
MKTSTIRFLAVGAAVVAGAAIFFVTRHAPSSTTANDSAAAAPTGNASQPANAQAIEVVAKGGYTPSTATAKAGVPVALKIRTDGTFDCTATVKIPSMNWSKHLGPTEEVTVQIPPQKAGSTLVGVCSMGMYNFKITFE